MLEVLQQVKILAGDRISLKLTEIDQIQVIGDRDRLKQVYINLLANAVKYTPTGGMVFLAIKKVGDQAQTVIEDTGPGIPGKDLPHIFERFYRGDKARTRSTDGSSFGLGLSIAYWIIKNHGGRIEVKSKEGPVRPSQFGFHWPGKVKKLSLSPGSCDKFPLSRKVIHPLIAKHNH